MSDQAQVATHDYTQRYWGHDYTFAPVRGGLEGKMQGWGTGIRKGDFLLLQNGLGSSRYKVVSVQYFSDPADMWEAEVKFYPRVEQELIGLSDG